MRVVSLTEAVSILKSDGVVAMPTETVYGLAASVQSPDGIEKIFSTKERPFFDPLIVHVSSIEQAKTLVLEFGVVAETLARAFWPGPLTMVLEKSSQVNPMITSGLQTVGVRMPRHPLALKLIEAAGVPLAAPSANKFGKTSPTTPEHVFAEFGDDVAIVDGGACHVGIESTIVSISNKAELRILRAGMITTSDIESCLKAAGVPFAWSKSEDRAMAPGQMKHHYMPSIPFVIVNDGVVAENMLKSELSAVLARLPDEVEGVRISKPTGAIVNPVELILPPEASAAARLFYSELRRLAQSNHDAIYFCLNKTHATEAWSGLRDRMRKAASWIF